MGQKGERYRQSYHTERQTARHAEPMVLVWHGTADVTAWERRSYGMAYVTDTVTVWHGTSYVMAYVTDQQTIKVSLCCRLEDSIDKRKLRRALCCVHNRVWYSKPYRLAGHTDSQTIQKPRAESTVSRQHTEARAYAMGRSLPQHTLSQCRNIGAAAA